ncbi:MAG: hypothetical protein L6Q84_23570 [Polyangiaceae bacterium]|nr:hypothetical protein [Polyangiaceae bacterium]
MTEKKVRRTKGSGKVSAAPDEAMQLAVIARGMAADLIGIAIGIEEAEQRAPGSASVVLADELERLREAWAVWSKPGPLAADTWRAIVVVRHLNHAKLKLDKGAAVAAAAACIAHTCGADGELARVPLAVWEQALAQWRGIRKGAGRPPDGEKPWHTIVLHLLKSAGCGAGITAPENLRDEVRRVFRDNPGLQKLADPDPANRG